MSPEYEFIDEPSGMVPTYPAPITQTLEPQVVVQASAEELPRLAGELTSLSALRALCGLSQSQLATLLGTKQPTVSLWEKKPITDLRIGTLNEVVLAMGGELQVAVILGDSRYLVTSVTDEVQAE